MEFENVLDLVREILPYVASIFACIVAFWKKSKLTKEEKLTKQEEKLQKKLEKVEKKKTALTEDFLKNLKTGGEANGNETQGNA